MAVIVIPLSDVPPNTTYYPHAKSIITNQFTQTIGGVYSALGVFGLFGNAIVIMMLVAVLRDNSRNDQAYKVKGKRYRMGHLLILSLSCVDLLFVLFMPFILYDTIQGAWIFGKPMCHLLWISECLNKSMTPWLQLGLAFFCYISACRPMSLIYLTRVRLTEVYIGLCFIGSALLNIPFFMYSNVYAVLAPTGHWNQSDFSIVTTKCLFRPPQDMIKLFAGTKVVLCYASPMCFQILFYTLVMVEVYRRRAQMRRTTLAAQPIRRKDAQATMSIDTETHISGGSALHVPPHAVTVPSRLESNCGGLSTCDVERNENIGVGCTKSYNRQSEKSKLVDKLSFRAANVEMNTYPSVKRRRASESIGKTCNYDVDEYAKTRMAQTQRRLSLAALPHLFDSCEERLLSHDSRDIEVTEKAVRIPDFKKHDMTLHPNQRQITISPRNVPVRTEFGGTLSSSTTSHSLKVSLNVQPRKTISSHGNDNKTENTVSKSANELNMPLKDVCFHCEVDMSNLQKGAVCRSITLQEAPTSSSANNDLPSPTLIDLGSCQVFKPNIGWTLPAPEKVIRKDRQVYGGYTEGKSMNRQQSLNYSDRLFVQSTKRMRRKSSSPCRLIPSGSANGCQSERRKVSTPNSHGCDAQSIVRSFIGDDRIGELLIPNADRCPKTSWVTIQKNSTASIRIHEMKHIASNSAFNAMTFLRQNCNRLAPASLYSRAAIRSSPEDKLRRSSELESHGSCNESPCHNGVQNTEADNITAGHCKDNCGFRHSSLAIPQQITVVRNDHSDPQMSKLFDERPTLLTRRDAHSAGDRKQTKFPKLLSMSTVFHRRSFRNARLSDTPSVKFFIETENTSFTDNSPYKSITNPNNSDSHLQVPNATPSEGYLTKQKSKSVTRTQTLSPEIPRRHTEPELRFVTKSMSSIKFWNVVSRSMLLLGSYLVCWSPFWIATIWSFSDTSRSSASSVSLFLAYIIHALPYLNVALNPVLYVMLNRSVRQAYVNCQGRVSTVVSFLPASFKRQINK